MAEAASAHQAACATREETSYRRAGHTRRTSADSQRAQQGATAAAAAAPAALDSLSRFQQLAENSPKMARLQRLQALADASPRVAQLRRLQALADGQLAPVAQLAGGPDEDERVQGKFATAELPPQLQQAPRANNTGLPDQLKSGIESLSGLTMDHVRVHFNSSQPAQLSALAYAQGSDIHLAPGQERHLPHEAWHVVQQAQGRVRPTLQMKHGVPVNDDVVLEREADVMGAKAVQYEGGVSNLSAGTSMGADAGELRQQRPAPGMEATIVQRKVGNKPKQLSSDKFIRSWTNKDGDEYHLTERRDRGVWTRVWTLEVFSKSKNPEGQIGIYFRPPVLKPDGLEVPKKSQGMGYGAKLGSEAVKVMTGKYMEEQTKEANQIKLDLVNPLSAHISLKQLTLALNGGFDMQDLEAANTASETAMNYERKGVYDPAEFHKFWGRLVYLVKNNEVTVKCSAFGAELKEDVDKTTIESVDIEGLVNAMVNAKPPRGFVMNITAPKSKQSL
ncbi:MAG: DUF4157 domain-containing protein [Synechococcaceae cyanobacterium]|nr:DUF4157 domain-containing protein [Synechococcaceae cyanobacterium]